MKLFAMRSFQNIRMNEANSTRSVSLDPQYCGFQSANNGAGHHDFCFSCGMFECSKFEEMCPPYVFFLFGCKTLIASEITIQT